MKSEIAIEECGIERLDELVILGRELNEEKSDELMEARFREMFELDCYRCFVALKGDVVVAMCGVWLIVKLYSGKQVELDNVVVSPECQSEGIGRKLMAHVEEWAQGQGCLNSELNAYVGNPKAHKFYFSEGYSVVGFHFQKKFE